MLERLTVAVAALTTVAAVAVVVIVLAGGINPPGGDDAGAAAATPASASAPIAPRRIVARAPAVAERPGRLAEAEEDRIAQLGLPLPERFRAGGPRRALAEFLGAWHDRAWDRMALWTERRFRTALEQPAGELERRFAAERLRGWAIVGVRPRGPGAVAVRVALATRGMRPALIREERTFELRRPAGGRWGVVLDTTRAGTGQA